MSLLLRLGADVQRLIDGETWSIERFAAHLGRIPALRGEGPSPLVLLSRTNPIALALLHTRRVLEEAVPRLASATWLIFHDESDDPFFAAGAADLGTLDVPFDHAPIWDAPHGYRFLILSAAVEDLRIVTSRVADLWRVALPDSGPQLILPRPAESAWPMPLTIRRKRA